MPAPTVDPMDRVDAVPAGSYRLNERVWVHRGQWYPGRVRAVSSAAVLVDYWRMGGRGSMTDTVTPLYVMARTEWVGLVDGEVDTHGGQ